MNTTGVRKPTINRPLARREQIQRVVNASINTNTPPRRTTAPRVPMAPKKMVAAVSRTLVPPTPVCSCGLPCELKTCSQGENMGRSFYSPSCKNDGFVWQEKLLPNAVVKCRPPKNSYHYIVKCESAAEVPGWRRLHDYLVVNNISPDEVVNSGVLGLMVGGGEDEPQVDGSFEHPNGYGDVEEGGEDQVVEEDDEPLE